MLPCTSLAWTRYVGVQLCASAVAPIDVALQWSLFTNALILQARHLLAARTNPPVILSTQALDDQILTEADPFNRMLTLASEVREDFPHQGGQHRWASPEMGRNNNGV